MLIALAQTAVDGNADEGNDQDTTSNGDADDGARLQRLFVELGALDLCLNVRA
jgi:hypothetical protein